MPFMAKKKMISCDCVVFILIMRNLSKKCLFVKQIESELLSKKIDIAVHALKDMPAIETVGLRTNTFLKRNDPRDAFLSYSSKSFKDLLIYYYWCLLVNNQGMVKQILVGGCLLGKK